MQHQLPACRDSRRTPHQVAGARVQRAAAVYAAHVLQTLVQRQADLQRARCDLPRICQRQRVGQRVTGLQIAAVYIQHAQRRGRQIRPALHSRHRRLHRRWRRTVIGRQHREVLERRARRRVRLDLRGKVQDFGLTRGHRDTSRQQRACRCQLWALRRHKYQPRRNLIADVDRCVARTGIDDCNRELHLIAGQERRFRREIGDRLARLAQVRRHLQRQRRRVVRAWLVRIVGFVRLGAQNRRALRVDDVTGDRVDAQRLKRGEILDLRGDREDRLLPRRDRHHVKLHVPCVRCSARRRRFVRARSCRRDERQLRGQVKAQRINGNRCRGEALQGECEGHRARRTLLEGRNGQRWRRQKRRHQLDDGSLRRERIRVLGAHVRVRNNAGTGDFRDARRGLDFDLERDRAIGFAARRIGQDAEVETGRECALAAHIGYDDAVNRGRSGYVVGPSGRKRREFERRIVGVERTGVQQIVGVRQRVAR